MKENTELWDSVHKIDLKAIKTVEKPYKHSTINGYYVIKMATDRWGPIGAKWGYNILKDEMTTGGIMLDGKGDNWGNEITHTIQIELFCPDGTVIQYGHTPYVYRSKWGPLTDHEAPKKSLTDAIKKALSMLGFAGEVWLGEMDDFNYLEARKAEQSINVAEDKDEEIESQVNQFREDYKKAVETVKALDEGKALTAYLNKTIIQLDRKSSIPHLAEHAKKAIEQITILGQKRVEEIKNAK